MKTKTPTHTPTPLGIREPFTDEEKRLNRIFITGKRTDGGQPTDEDFDFLELPYAPKGSPKHAMAEYVVRAVNAHEQLLNVAKLALANLQARSETNRKWSTHDQNTFEKLEQVIARAEKGE